MRKILTSKKLAAVAVAAVAVTGTGVAYAYWTTSGSGTGSGSTTAGTPDVTVTQTTVLSAMYPGDVAQTISGTVKNNAVNDAYVTKVVASIDSVTKGAAAGTCDATDFTLANTEMLVGQDLAKDEVANFTGATIQFNNKGTNQDACKDASLVLKYTVS